MSFSGCIVKSQMRKKTILKDQQVPEISMLHLYAHTKYIYVGNVLGMIITNYH